MNNNKNIYGNWAHKQTEALMATCLVTSIEILKDDFGFTKEQLNKFADKFVPTLEKNLKKK